MSSLQTTYHNIRAANGFKIPHLESHETLEKMKEFDFNPQVKPIHKVTWQYMHMVGVMCLYIRAVPFCTRQSQLCQEESHI